MDNNENKPKTEAVIKLEAVRAVKKLRSDSEWTITQEIFQEIQAGHIISNPDKMPPITQMTEELKKEIEARYSEDEEMKKLILDSVPQARSVRAWLKMDGWDNAVWKKVRVDSLFSSHKRAEVIESLRARAVTGSDQAAKLWLQLSGDLVDKVEVNTQTVDTFRQINSILHRKNAEEN